MKKNLLLAVSIVFGLSFHSLMAATDLVQNSGFESGTDNWNTDSGTFTITAANGPSASGTASALLGGGSIDSESEIGQQIATVPGTSYVVQFDYKTLDSGTGDDEFCIVYVTDTNNNILSQITRQGGSIQPTTTFQTAVGTFTATTSGATINVVGYDKSVIDNVVVASGSFSEPGKYTGSVKVSSTIPSESVGSFHTESVVARVTPSGGVYLIEQPSGTVETGGFENENTLAISGTTVTVSVKDKTDIKFTTTTNTVAGGSGGLDEVPVTDMDTFSLKRVGK
jgi:hypothetical protein